MKRAIITLGAITYLTTHVLAATPMMEEHMQRYNFKTQQATTIRVESLTDSLAVELIPQHTAAQGLYHVLRAQGHSITQALQAVLEAIVSHHLSLFENSIAAEQKPYNKPE